MKPFALTIGLISSALIAYQLALMRVFSFTQWYHFAFMIISIALLGFGTSGVFLSIFKQRLLNHFFIAFSFLLLACSISMIGSIQLLRFIHFEPYLLIIDFGQIWSLVLVCGLVFLPFAFGACAIGLAFIYFTERIHQLYFANLFGSAMGGILALGLMFFIHPFKLIPVISFIAFFVALFILLKIPADISHKTTKVFRIIFTFLLGINLILLFLAFSPVPIHLKISEYKGLSKAQLLPGAKVIEEKISPLGIINVLESLALRYAPGVSLSFDGNICPQLGVFNDGEWVGAIFNRKKGKRIEFLDYTISSLPYCLKQEGDVLVIGVGTGAEIQVALQNKASNITGIELNPQIIELIERDFADRTNNLYNLTKEYPSKISILKKEARSFLTQTEEYFDIISIPLMEGFTLSAASAYSLFENYLFTIESFRLMFDHLGPQGILAITTWINHPPRQAMKLLTMLIETLKQEGIRHPEEHFAGIRSWDSTTLLLKKGKFTEEDIEYIRQFCNRYSFDPIHYPGIAPWEVNRFNQLEQDYFYNTSQELFYGRKDSVYQTYPFFIEPATDNRPYYSHFLKLANILFFLELLGRDALPLMDWGYLLLLVTLIALILLSAIFILLPLFVLRQSFLKSGNKLWTFLYFSGLGLGFMFIEMVMIQRFILFLGHPIYSVSAIITGILLFSGLGSLFSKRLDAEKNFRKFVGLILALGIIYSLLLNKAFSLILYFPMWLKYISALLIISLLAFFMGMLFPTGLAVLSRVSSSLLPWAWGINGFMSVISPVIATFLAIKFGLAVVFALAIVSYGVVLIIGVKPIKQSLI